MKYLIIAIALIVSGCANNQYDLASQPDYRDSLNPNCAPWCNGGTAGKNGG